jgi:glucose-1-phosphate thymidylyltransferase
LKGVILAGGSGTRLRPLTSTIAKQLLPVGNRPILFYVVDRMVDAGITDIAIVVSPETGAAIRALVGDGNLWGARVQYVVQDRPGGIAHAVLSARDFVGSDPFCVFLGDCLVGSGVREAVRTFERSADMEALILLKEVSDPRGFGIAVVDDRGSVARLIEKPAEPPSNLALVGIYLLRPSIFGAIGSIRPSARGELEITDALSKLMEVGARVHFERLEGWWVDTGTKDDLLLANERVLTDRVAPAIEGEVSADSILSGPICVAPGATVLRSTLAGPLIVGRGVRIEDSRIGPFTSLGDGCTVLRSSIERSVLLEGCRVEVARLERSVLGRRATVRAEGRAGVMSVLLGDDATVQ